MYDESKHLAVYICVCANADRLRAVVEVFGELTLNADDAPVASILSPNTKVCASCVRFFVALFSIGVLGSSSIVICLTLSANLSFVDNRYAQQMTVPVKIVNKTTLGTLIQPKVFINNNKQTINVTTTLSFERDGMQRSR